MRTNLDGNLSQLNFFLALGKEPDSETFQHEPFSSFLSDLLQSSNAHTTAHLVKYSQARMNVSSILDRGC